MAKAKFLQTALFLSLLFSSTVSTTRTFNAAPKHSRLRRRDVSFTPSLDGHALFYAEESFDGMPNAAVRLSLSPKYPMLIHEDVFEHITVQCINSNIHVTFEAENTMLQARNAWGVDDFLFVTAQPDCAPPGQHAAFMVTPSLSSAAAETIVLSAVAIPLRKAMHSIYVDLGDHLVSELDSSALPLMKRQAATTGTASIATSTAIVSTSISFTAPAPTETGPSKVRSDISFSQVDKLILPPAQDIRQLLPNPKVFDNLEVKCANCVMKGTLELSVAGFALTDSDGDANSPMRIAAGFTQNGYFEFTANDVTSTMEFDVKLLPGFSLFSFEAALPSLPLLPLSIPGVLNFGPVLDLTFPMQVTLNTPVSFTTGFQLEVPNNSKIVLNVSDFESSYVSGFPDAKITPLPFNINANNLSLSVSAGFQPRILLAAGVGSALSAAQVRGGVGVFFDLPQMVAKITPLQNQNANCNGPAANGQTNTRILIEYTSTNLVGARAELTIALPDFPDYKRVATQPLLSGTIPLGNQCLLWNQQLRELEAPPKSGTALPPHLPKVSLALILSAFTFVML